MEDKSSMKIQKFSLINLFIILLYLIKILLYLKKDIFKLLKVLIKKSFNSS